MAYPSGTISEHTACRNSCAVFDVSHLGTLVVTGASAFELLQGAFTNDLGRIEPGRAQYTHLLDPDTASVVDDIIVWWMTESTFEVIPNASNTGAVNDVLGSLADGLDVSITDTTDSRAMIAIQGPTARKVLGAVSGDASAVGRFRITPFTFQGVECVSAGTGYTGEDGVECAVPASVAPAFWDAVVAAGAVPAGLGARDTLRLEAAFPLHGHELGGGLTTLQAGLGWVVGWDKPAFVGRDALVRQKESGGYKVMVGLSVDGRRPPREGQTVLSGGGVVGSVTSGNFSPTLGHGIALAMVDDTVPVGDTVSIDVRGTEMPASVVALPFYKSKG